MSRDYLGKNFDIHGGLDLKFPHRKQNAQSKYSHDGVFANFWLHTGPNYRGREDVKVSRKFRYNQRHLEKISPGGD